MLYTRKGDTGTSGLFGTKERMPKCSPVYETLGSLDELNSLLGFCRARTLREPKHGGVIASEILSAQERLFVIQAEVAGRDISIAPSHIDELEHAIAELEAEIVNPHSFVIPGSTELSGLLDYARAVSRRAERATIATATERAVSKHSLAYLNRLSSFLYVAARVAATTATAPESAPTYS